MGLTDYNKNNINEYWRLRPLQRYSTWHEKCKRTYIMGIKLIMDVQHGIPQAIADVLYG